MKSPPLGPSGRTNFVFPSKQRLTAVIRKMFLRFLADFSRQSGSGDLLPLKLKSRTIHAPFGNAVSWFPKNSEVFQVGQW